MNRSLVRRIDTLLPHDARRMSFRLRHPQQFHAWQAMRNDTDSKGYSFEPFDRHRCIFVHVPKCAGVSVSSALFGSLAGGHRRIGTYRLVYSRREFRNYFKFAFVRNPWDRLLSAFRFLKNGGFGPEDEQWTQENLSRYPDFDGFVRQWVNRKNILSWPHFLPQTHFICVDGRLPLDFLGRFEKLAEDYSYVCQRLGIDSPLSVHNQTKTRQSDYRDFYNDETRNIVAEVYREDISTLGYSFEGVLREPHSTRQTVAA